MKDVLAGPRRPRKWAKAFTLVEMLVAVALGTMVLGSVVALTLYGTRCFVSVGNYADLDNQSRNALDVICRDLRHATAVLAFQTNLPVLSLTATNANQGLSMILTWDSNAGTLVYQKTGQTTETYLTQCDSWNFGLYQRTPLISSTNILFFPATNSTGVLDPSFCKLIDMSWKCSRSILSVKIDTESVQTAQIVLRNKL